MKKWIRACYQPNRPLEDGKYVTACTEHIALSLRAASEGMVLLKNEGHVLPLQKGKTLALFGRGIHDMVKGGGGSGDVFTPYVTTLAQGIEMVGGRVCRPLSDYYLEDIQAQYRDGAVPGLTVEPPVPAELLRQASSETDTALIAFSRFSGEGWERQGGVWDNPEQTIWEDETLLPRIAERIYPDGDFYLTAQEKELVEAVKTAFSHVIIVLNTGAVMDTSWIRADEKIDGALLMWQGGMEGGTAAARILFGEENPSGKLPDTFAAALEDYPSTSSFHESHWFVEYSEDIYVGYRYFETIPGAAAKVVYPFGYGLSYTTFDQKVTGVSESPEAISFTVEVTNSGHVPGREVTAVYYQAPQGKLGRPARELGAFAKTKLLSAGERETLTLTIAKRQMAAFDDLGKIAPFSFVLEAGAYRFYLGSNVREAARIQYTWDPEKDIPVEQLSDRLRPHALSRRLMSDGSWEELATDENPDMNACAFEKMTPGSEEGIFPERYGRERHIIRNRFCREGIHPLEEVAEGKITAREFVMQLSDDELIRILGGTPNRGVANTCGFGGLEEYGMPAVMTADGPAGVRIEPQCGVAATAWPCETLLAATWDQELALAVGKAAAEEVKENNLQVWLAPAMNIHRNPICGRNFEYFSEDPYLTGKIAGAEVRGIQSMGVSACIKHFACNNKETNRKNSDSRVSLRALREIYLRGFEMVVKEAHPWTVMSSYNAINGQRASESHDLLTGILRDEWGYDGVVTTDWWTRGEHYKEILAGNDIKMATGFPERVKEALRLGVITREDLLRCAERVAALICRLD